MNVPTPLPGLPLRLALLAAVLGFGILSGFAAESKLYVLWDTISPDGNRIYRTLHGLLSSDEKNALVEEERAWLLKRDAIKSQEEKQAFVQTRIDELKVRVGNIVEEKEKQ